MYFPYPTTRKTSYSSRLCCCWPFSGNFCWWSSFCRSDCQSGYVSIDSKLKNFVCDSGGLSILSPHLKGNLYLKPSDGFTYSPTKLPLVMTHHSLIKVDKPLLFTTGKKADALLQRWPWKHAPRGPMNYWAFVCVVHGMVEKILLTRGTFFPSLGWFWMDFPPISNSATILPNKIYTKTRKHIGGCDAAHLRCFKYHLRCFKYNSSLTNISQLKPPQMYQGPSTPYITWWAS